MRYLTAHDLLKIHYFIISETTGSHGVRDRHALAALEDLPKQTAFGNELYPGLFMKAALYIRNIIFSHPFVDGNKRTALTSAGIFLELNGYRITAPRGAIEAFALRVIAEHLELPAIAAWLEQNSSQIRPPKRRKQSR